jgi:hypothetical protein
LARFHYEKNNCLLGCIFILSVSTVVARGTYQEPEDFLNEVFNGNVPQVKKLWIQGKIKEGVREVLGHDMGVLRVSYWQEDDRTAWILDEIGKSLPITVGIVINNSGIETLKILIFRESRGWEVRYPFFTDQFINAGIDDNLVLDRGIDGISGATLSVKAVSRIAAIALFLHQQVIQ